MHSKNGNMFAFRHSNYELIFDSRTTKLTTCYFKGSCAVATPSHLPSFDLGYVCLLSQTETLATPRAAIETVLFVQT